MYLITSSGGFFYFSFFLYFSISFRISSRGRPVFFAMAARSSYSSLVLVTPWPRDFFFPHGSISRFHSFLPALRGEPPADMLPDAQRRGVPEQQLHHLFFVLPSAHTSQKDTGTALFSSPQGPYRPPGLRLRTAPPPAKPTASAVMSSRLQDSSAISSPASAVSPQKGPDAVGPLKILFTHSVSDL